MKKFKAFWDKYTPAYAEDLTIYYSAKMEGKRKVEYVDITDIKINEQGISEYLYIYLKTSQGEKWVSEITKILETEEEGD